MGAWGTALYSNDTANDIRGDYVDLLRRGNSNEDALKKLMEKDGDCIGIEEEEPPEEVPQKQRCVFAPLRGWYCYPGN